jgi:uncharacterized protein
MPLIDCLAVLVALTLSALPVLAQSPSFDCSKAATPREKAVCATPKLAALDAQVAAAYRAELAHLSPAAARDIRSDQREWLHFLEVSCPANSTSRFIGPIASCLQPAYATRLNQLQPFPQIAAEAAFYLRAHFAVAPVKNRSESDPANPGFGTGIFWWPQIDNPNPAQKTWNLAVFNALLKSTAGEGNETPATLDTAMDPEGSLELSALPVAANDHLIVTNIENYTYAYGGAHGGTGDRSFSWWIDSGHALVASDVLRLSEATKSSLVNLVYTRLKSNHDYGDSLWEAAQVKEAIRKELTLVTAWQVTQEGLTLSFGQYEVGPYAIGEPTVLLSWQELQPALAPGFHAEIVPVRLPARKP